MLPQNNNLLNCGIDIMKYDSKTYYIDFKKDVMRGTTDGIQASKAILKGEFNIDVPIGSRYYLEGLHYIVTEQIKQNTFKLQCETAGEQGNHYFGKLLPVEYIQGLTTANLIEVLIPGEDVESDQSLRQRYYDSLFGLAFGRNIADYKQKNNRRIFSRVK